MIEFLLWNNKLLESISRYKIATILIFFCHHKGKDYFERPYHLVDHLLRQSHRQQKSKLFWILYLQYLLRAQKLHFLFDQSMLSVPQGLDFDLRLVYHGAGGRYDELFGSNRQKTRQFSTS
jgi:hypothetical protein